MAEQGKQMRVCAYYSESFAYYSVKLVLLASRNSYAVDSNTFFLSGEALHSYKILPYPKSDLL
jgi:hypothetical protein